MERRLYDHVKELLIEELAGSPPGQRLPSRAALAERFGVNRTTIERAVSELIGEGLLYARDKSGHLYDGTAARRATMRRGGRQVGGGHPRHSARHLSGDHPRDPGRGGATGGST